MTSYHIKEDGKNGTAEVFSDRILRTKKSFIGKDDTQVILMKSITSVSLNSKMLSSDIASITVGSKTYIWKMKNAAEFVAEVQEHLLGN